MTHFTLVFLTAILALVTFTAGQSCTKLTTFNTALLPRIEGYDDRRTAVPAAVRDEDADVMCLQEVWFEQDVYRIVEAAKDEYPYHFSTLHSSVGSGPRARRNFFTETPCNRSEAYHFYTGIFWCALNAGCVEQFQQQFELGLQCAVQNCRGEFQSQNIRPACLTCVVLTAESLFGLLSQCTSEFYGRDNRLNEAGLVLLSKKPLMNVEYDTYFPGQKMMLPRGYIKSEIQDLDGPLVCTHLTSLFPLYFEYALPFNTYLDQQAAEIETLSALYGTSKHYVFGDFNTGPARPDETGERQLMGEGPENFQTLLDKGYSSPYLDQDGRCTYCISNPIANGVHNVGIDQTFVMSDTTSTITAQRVLDGTVNNLPLSDHYGVRTQICPANPQ